jgi:hypothetical protein
MLMLAEQSRRTVMPLRDRREAPACVIPLSYSNPVEHTRLASRPVDQPSQRGRHRTPDGHFRSPETPLGEGR